MSEIETPLSGGNINNGVVRVGNTVRRAQTAASPTIHRLLLHLERVGFGACPRFLGIDDKNREILNYIEGDTGHGQQIWQQDGPLIETARMLRAYHDATQSFAPQGDESWAVVFADADRHEVICHNDFAPYNLVFFEGIPKAVVDFDLAGPGPRLRDVAYAAFWMTPLSFHAADTKSLALGDLNAGCRRLTLFCQSYGIPADDALLEMVGQVLKQMADAPTVAAAVGEAAMRKLAREGHLDHWRAEKAAFDCHKTALKKALNQTMNSAR
ncbi:MAG: aminoglycoside phosphotransferase family protein [Alphaproteobacteria bacterium]|nr:aminoglycoside phosphotransferase family protein [Alphaproteobacteria bacterium]